MTADPQATTDPGAAARYALHRAFTTPISGGAKAAVAAVVALTAGHGIVAADVPIARVVAVLGKDPNSTAARSRVGRHLGEAADAGIVLYVPGRGRQHSAIGLPAPPADWTDPTLDAGGRP